MRVYAGVDAAPAPARLWMVGDLVNRGPQSLAALRWAFANEDRITTVLGNHDLHLLAVAAGIRALHRSDTLALFERLAEFYVLNGYKFNIFQLDDNIKQILANERNITCINDFFCGIICPGKDRGLYYE